MVKKMAEIICGKTVSAAKRLDIKNFHKVDNVSVRNRLNTSVWDKVYMIDLKEYGISPQDVNFTSSVKENGYGQSASVTGFFENGERCQLARWPNDGFELLPEATKGGAAVSNTDIQNGARLILI